MSSGHICRFEDMQVVSVLLDEIMKDPENPTEDLVLNLDIKVSILGSIWSVYLDSILGSIWSVYLDVMAHQNRHR